MKKIYVFVCVVLTTAVWADRLELSVDKGILGVPSYDVRASQYVLKFDIPGNGKLEELGALVAAPSSPPSEPSEFRSLLSQWDAKSDWQTSRGTLEVLWHRTGTKVPDDGWPAMRRMPSLEELRLMYPVGMPD